MISPPLLPVAPSWYPGHMRRFFTQLPELLARTHIVLEARDSRLPLTSINPEFEAALQKWRQSRGHGQNGMCERIVVYTKRDLMPRWGEEPLRKALAKRFAHRIHFTAEGKPHTIRHLHSDIVSLVKDQREIAASFNVLVIGMPNVGKSTLLNALRWATVEGAAKAFRTSPLPGLTRTTSTPLKLHTNPLVYSVDTPGVMIPFLGRGELGKERAMKLALTAGIKESLFDTESMCSYLLHRLYLLNPQDPAYMSVLPPNSPRPENTEDFLDALARRLGAVQKGGSPDIERAERWFIQWWRNGDAVSAPSPYGWGLDFDFMSELGEGAKPPSGEEIEKIMDKLVDDYVSSLSEEREGERVSLRQEKKAEREAKTKALMQRRALA
ncbi:Mitochondrial GTPase [Ceratobasidium sp. UAMH 11750]|nr:Mitochondrial GTPase [Ceratobasidium sp. UAMH 11750]